MKPVATYQPGAPAPRVPGTVTLELDEELALYVLGVLGSGSDTYGADPPVPGSAGFDLYCQLMAALSEGGVPQVDRRAVRHGNAHWRHLTRLS